MREPAAVPQKTSLPCNGISISPTFRLPDVSACGMPPHDTSPLGIPGREVNRRTASGGRRAWGFTFGVCRAITVGEMQRGDPMRVSTCLCAYGTKTPVPNSVPSVVTSRRTRNRGAETAGAVISSVRVSRDHVKEESVTTATTTPSRLSCLCKP